MIKVSVIIPVYNAELYIRECLESLLVQTLTEFEIICINDGSTDATLRILNDYVQKDRRIRVISQANAGAGVARNLGLKYAKGKYLAILDADDFFQADMLEKAYRQCERDGADFCVFRSDEYDNITGIYHPSPGTINQLYLPKVLPFSAQNVAQYIFQLFIGWSWDKLYNREFIKKTHLKFQALRTTNDAFFVFMANIQAANITIADEVLAHHRTNVRTSLSLTREQSWDCCYRAVLAIRKGLFWRRQYKMVEQSFINWALNFLLWNVRTLQGEAKNSLIYMLKKKYFKKLRFDKYPRSYFYNQDDYQEYLELRDMIVE